jgi:hypothetical protein
MISHFVVGSRMERCSLIGSVTVQLIFYLTEPPKLSLSGSVLIQG